MARPCGFVELFREVLGTTYPNMSKIGLAVPKLWPKMWAPGPQIRQGTFCLLRFMQLYWACTAGLVRFWANLRRPQKPPYLPKPQNHENGITRERAGLLTRVRARWKAEHNAVSLVPPAWDDAIVKKRYEVLIFLNRASRVQKVPRRQIIPCKVLLYSKISV